MTGTIYVFDSKNDRVEKVRDALDDYQILQIAGISDIPDDHSELACVIIDTEFDRKLIEAAIGILGEKAVPAFIWAPIGKTPAALDYKLPLHTLPSPPSVDNIAGIIRPILETEDRNLILLAISDNRLANYLASKLMTIGHEVKRVLDRKRLDDQIRSDEPALVFIDMQLAGDICCPSSEHPRFPVMINVPDGIGVSAGPVELDPMLTLVSSSMSADAITEAIEDAIIRSEKAAHIETGKFIAHESADQSFRMTDRLAGLLIKETRINLSDKLAEEFNLLNAHSMGLVNEFVEIMSDISERSFLLIETIDTPELSEELLGIESKLDQARDIANTFNSVEWYKTTGTPEQVQLKKVVSEALSALKANRRRKDIEWLVDIDDLGVTMGNKGHFTECFLNILINAYEAIDESGMINVMSGSDDKWNIIFINDNGIGMNHESLAQAVKPFYTTKKASHPGLGLTISKGIIESHGGEMTIESSPEKGTIVTVRLPRTLETKTTLDTSKHPDILLVAHRKSVGFLQTLLVRHGLSVLSFDNIGEAVHMIKRVSPRMILVQAGLEHLDVGGIRMLASAKGKAQLVLLDPQGQLPVGIKGLDSAIRASFPIHHLLAIVSSYLSENIETANV